MYRKISNIGLVHDYFTQQGGAERVAEQLYDILGRPDVYATVAFEDVLPRGLADASIGTTWMQKLPALRRLHRLYFPIYPLGISSLDLSQYDVVVSSSSSYAKGVRTRSDATHICYCHTPTRWVWRYRDYAERENFGVSKRIILPLVLAGLRVWDQNAARQPDQFVANSLVVAERIRDFYGRDAVIIPPPIEINRFHISSSQDDYYLILSRLVSYKRIDLAIGACNLLNRRLVIIGDGPDRARLERMAGPSIQFMGRLSDAESAKFASRCRALLFPGEEDFGMVPLEIASAGRPTIAFRAGGAVETIVEGVTGTFFEQATPESLADAILESESRSWSATVLRNHAARYDLAVFRRRFEDLLSSMGITIPEHSDLMVTRAAG